ETAVTPAAVLAAISSSNTGTQATATSTGEADSLYTNILSSSALQLSLPSGKRAIVMAECMVLDGAAPATPVAYGLAILSMYNVKLYSNKIATQSKQTIIGVVSGPVESQISLVTTELPTGAVVHSQSLVVMPI